MLSSMQISQGYASQNLANVQTINQNLAAYVKTFNNLVIQGSAGSGLKTYVQ